MVNIIIGCGWNSGIFVASGLVSQISDEYQQVAEHGFS